MHYRLKLLFFNEFRLAQDTLIQGTKCLKEGHVQLDEKGALLNCLIGPDYLLQEYRPPWFGL